MKLILPVAGKGTRMRPITNTVAKALVPIAGKKTIQHIIDNVLKTQGITVSEIIFITGYLGEQIQEWAEETYDLPMRFIEQKVMNGSADAIRLAEPHVDEDMLVIFGDTLFDTDLEVIAEEDTDGIIWTAEVEDPRRFGVISHDEDMLMTELIEKPDNPTTNLVNVGMFYIKDYKSVFSMIDALYEHEIKAKGEYNFPEALDLMAKNGKKIRVIPVEKWFDTGILETTLATNKEFCKRQNKKNSIDESAVVKNSELDNCIVMKGARITNCNLHNSIIGPQANIKSVDGHLFVGSNAIVHGKHTLPKK